MNDGIFREIDLKRTADEAVAQFESLLLDGVLSSGDKLPGERELAERLDISRPVLREALKELENRELLVSRQGDGTYVADLIGQIFSPAVSELIARHERATRDYLEYRRELEGYAAELAARRATSADHENLLSIMMRMEKAHADNGFEAELAADVELHNGIGEAAHNVILLHSLRACYRLLNLGIFRHRKLIFKTEGARSELFAQHKAIVEAILAANPAAARKAAEDHIDFVIRSSDEATRAEERERVSELRRIHRTGAAPSTETDRSQRAKGARHES